MKPLGRARRVALCTLSAGWVLPMWLSAALFSSTVSEVLQFLAGGGRGWPSASARPGQWVTSFPTEQFSLQASAWLFTIGCIWLVGVIVFWVWRLTAEHTGVSN
jgi:hypothetical protein